MNICGRCLLELLAMIMWLDKEVMVGAEGLGRYKGLVVVEENE